MCSDSEYQNQSGANVCVRLYGRHSAGTGSRAIGSAVVRGRVSQTPGSSQFRIHHPAAVGRSHQLRHDFQITLCYAYSVQPFQVSGDELPGTFDIEATMSGSPDESQCARIRYQNRPGANVCVRLYGSILPVPAHSSTSVRSAQADECMERTGHLVTRNHARAFPPIGCSIMLPTCGSNQCCQMIPRTDVMREGKYSNVRSCRRRGRIGFSNENKNTLRPSVSLPVTNFGHSCRIQSRTVRLEQRRPRFRRRQ